jgi:N-acetylglutamate synthase-like GNAT family acetyltransferase
LTNDTLFTLRSASAVDSKAIKSLIYAVGINPMSLDWRRFTVAMDGSGTLIGCGQIKPHGDGSFELASIAVQPAWRRKGVAGAIINHLLAAHPLPLYLTCREGLDKYYEKFGFRELASAELPPYFQRIYQIVKWLQRLKILRHRLHFMVLGQVS